MGLRKSLQSVKSNHKIHTSPPSDLRIGHKKNTVAGDV